MLFSKRIFSSPDFYFSRWKQSFAMHAAKYLGDGTMALLEIPLGNPMPRKLMHYSLSSTPQSKEFLWSFKTPTNVYTHTCHLHKTLYFSCRVTQLAGRVNKSPARCTTSRGGQQFILLTRVTTTKLVILGAHRHKNKTMHPQLPKLTSNFFGRGQQTNLGPQKFFFPLILLHPLRPSQNFGIRKMKT